MCPPLPITTFTAPLTKRARFEQGLAQAMTSDAPPSPCVSICVMDGASGYCQGCWRTLDEIAAWGGLSAQDKRAVWQALQQRQSSLDNRP